MTTNFANLSVEIMARSTPVHPSVFGIVVPDHQMDKVKPFQDLTQPIHLVHSCLNRMTTMFLKRICVHLY